ncbi:uncharacterized protein LOC120344123 [Styela clava]
MLPGPNIQQPVPLHFNFGNSSSMFGFLDNQQSPPPEGLECFGERQQWGGGGIPLRSLLSTWVNVPPSSGTMTKNTKEMKLLSPTHFLLGFLLHACQFTEYLPNNEVGEELYQMLVQAFDRGLIFKMETKNGGRITWDEEILHTTDSSMVSEEDQYQSLLGALNNMGINQTWN